VLAYVGTHAIYPPREQEGRAAEWTSGTQSRAHRLGYITGLLHNALASSEEPEAFRPEPITREDVERWEDGIAAEVRDVVGRVPARAAALPSGEAELLREIAASESRYVAAARGLDALEAEGCVKTRIHGDYHLGQVLQAGEDFIILDFEGEPARSLDERRARYSPLRDVAGLLRSFDYAAYGALFELWQERESDAHERAVLENWVLLWEEMACKSLIAGYREAIALHTGPPFAPSDPETFARVVRVFEIEKAFYELVYEFNNRPAWIPIPARGLLRALNAG
jgi:maltose alpha-D-glucosyltransferase/alpha-amylase